MRGEAAGKGAEGAKKDRGAIGERIQLLYSIVWLVPIGGGEEGCVNMNNCNLLP